MLRKAKSGPAATSAPTAQLRRCAAQPAGEQGILRRAARARHEHRRAALRAEEPRLAAGRRPDVEDRVPLDRRRRCRRRGSGRSTSARRTARRSGRAERRCGSAATIPCAHVAIAPRRALEAVRRERDRHRLAVVAAAPLRVDRPVARRAAHERAVEPDRATPRRRDGDGAAGAAPRPSAHGRRARPHEQRAPRRRRAAGAMRRIGGASEHRRRIVATSSGARRRRRASAATSREHLVHELRRRPGRAQPRLRAGHRADARRQRVLDRARRAPSCRGASRRRSRRRDSAAGRATGRPARATHVARSARAVPGSATPSRSASRASSTMPIATASPCSSA